MAAVARDFFPELRFAASIADRFYRGRFLGQPVIERMVQFTRVSRRFRRLMSDLFVGAQEYRSLRGRLYRGLLPTLFEVALSRA
jgi:hypothetical protein